jgi:acetyl-CoA carboxylase carboxyl transferase alpha subunit
VVRDDEPSTIGRALRCLRAQHAFQPRTRATMKAASPSTLTAWERLQLVRSERWPRADRVIDVLLEDAVELRGDRTGAPDDEHVTVRVGRIREGQANIVAIGQVSSADGRIRPQGFRKAIRAIAMAGRMGLPVVTVIDTRGADPAASSEGAGVAVAIARTFEAMLACPSPTLAVLTGEGGSGGALSMAVADRVVAWENAVFSVIAPEGAATILYRDASKAPDLAERLRITVPDLIDLGLVDAVVPEPDGGVCESPQLAMEVLAGVVIDEVERLVGMRSRRRSGLRHRRWRGIAPGLT